MRKQCSITNHNLATAFIFVKKTIIHPSLVNDDIKVSEDQVEQLMKAFAAADKVKPNKHFAGSCELLSFNLILMLTSCS